MRAIPRLILGIQPVSGLVLGGLAGDVWVQQWSHLPPLGVWLMLSAAGMLFAWWRLWLAAGVAFGIAWACCYGDWQLRQLLPLQLQGRDLLVQGYPASIPKQYEDHLSFDFIVTQAEAGVPEKLKLAWYRTTYKPKAGEGLQLTLRLKRPHGRLNPGGFDYEAWLFANGFAASGYVREQDGFQAIDPGFSLQRLLAKGRQALADRIEALLPEGRQTGVIKALTIGAQDAISQQQWQVFRKTGVIHLIVISGSHIGLIAGWLFWLTRSIWRRWGGLRYPPHQVAALVGWSVAVLYSLLAGMAIPVQRALVMLTVVMAALLAQRHVTGLQVLLLALAAVIAVDPLAVLSVGFWLSFVAVVLLMYVGSGRLGPASVWRRAIVAQWATALGLAPLLIGFFQQISLIAPLANWLAVPLIGLLLVPLSLLALLLSFLSWSIAAGLFAIIDFILQAGYAGLQRMAEWPLATWSLPQPSPWALWLGLLGVGLLLAPKGLPGRYLGWLLLLPMLQPMTDRPRPGEFRLSLLDVGQGLAAVVVTANHVLVFDTGARFSEQSDMGESVLIPYLHQQNRAVVDTLIVSHGDNDHSGGAEALLQQIAVEKLLSSVEEFAEREGGDYCRAGQRWQWDGVEFAMLAPIDEPLATENDNSCVLKVAAANASVLLTGDIEQAAETRLVERYGQELASRLLIAPHHGSKTSSSTAFLRQVDPELILIPAGHRNRFGFPHPSVIERYQRLGIDYLNTADSGAISIDAGIEPPRIRRERIERRRYWMTEEAG